MTAPQQPIPTAGPMPEYVSKYVASEPDFTCECGETFRITGDTPAKKAAAFDAWTCPCVPKPELVPMPSLVEVRPLALAAGAVAAFAGWLRWAWSEWPS